MRYICTNCIYIYDEVLWDSDLEIDAWTKYDDLPLDFSCPTCLEWKEHFSAIEEEVNYIDEDNAFASWVEKEHTIFHTIDDENLYVSVWFESHSMSDGHSIRNINIYDEYGDLIEEKVLKLDTKPEVKFENFDFDEFEIRITCSSHWVWGKKIGF